VPRDLGHRNYHAPEARETQRRNRRLRLSLLHGFRLEDDGPSIILPESPALARLQRGARAAVKATAHEIGLSHEVTVDLRDTCG
jgi:hypothetical protein